jgi:hypothetical protein
MMNRMLPEGDRVLDAKARVGRSIESLVANCFMTGSLPASGLMSCDSLRGIESDRSR